MKIEISAVNIYGKEISFAYGLRTDERLVSVAYFLERNEVCIIALGCYGTCRKIGCSLCFQTVDYYANLGCSNRSLCKSVSCHEIDNHLAQHVFRVYLHGAFCRSCICSLAYQKFASLVVLGCTWLMSFSLSESVSRGTRYSQ